MTRTSTTSDDIPFFHSLAVKICIIKLGVVGDIAGTQSSLDRGQGVMEQKLEL